MNTMTPVDKGATAPNPARAEAALLPLVDVIEDADGIVLIADLPGVAKEQLSLRVLDDQLHIEGDLALPLPAGAQGCRNEVRRSHYRRAFTLSKELDANQVSAELAHGVLRVRIPKAAHAQPRRITVQLS